MLNLWYSRSHLSVPFSINSTWMLFLSLLLSLRGNTALQCKIICQLIFPLFQYFNIKMSSNFFFLNSNIIILSINCENQHFKFGNFWFKIFLIKMSWHIKNCQLKFFEISYINLRMCWITHKIFMRTFFAFKRDTTIEITPTPYSGILTFCDKFCL